MADFRRGATTPASNSGSFAGHDHSAPEAELETSAQLNFQRLQREAQITDPADPDYNSDLDIVLPGTTKTYRDLIGEGIDPNDRLASDASIERELDKAIHQSGDAPRT